MLRVHLNTNKCYTHLTSFNGYHREYVISCFDDTKFVKWTCPSSIFSMSVSKKNSCYMIVL